MTTNMRPYINKKYDQEVDDGCLEYRSVPMAVVNKLLKVNHSTNDFDGIKQIYNKIPPRPINILALATSICRINNLPYTQVNEIAKKIIKEEISDVEQFVSNNNYSDFNFNNPEMNQTYIPEQPTRSTNGFRLMPNQMDYPKDEFTGISKNKEIVSLILGDLNETMEIGAQPYISPLEDLEMFSPEEIARIRTIERSRGTQASPMTRGMGMQASPMMQGMGTQASQMMQSTGMQANLPVEQKLNFNLSRSEQARMRSFGSAQYGEPTFNEGNIIGHRNPTNDRQLMRSTRSAYTSDFMRNLPKVNNPNQIKLGFKQLAYENTPYYPEFAKEEQQRLIDLEKRKNYRQKE